jgi:hypothetical protein
MLIYSNIFSSPKSKHSNYKMLLEWEHTGQTTLFTKTTTTLTHAANSYLSLTFHEG